MTSRFLVENDDVLSQKEELPQGKCEEFIFRHVGLEISGWVAQV